jgi:CheY-like chemotaxis protein/HPt (histidine-containing phosphotransfer) domain-containing protein
MLHGLRALIVDDQAINREVLSGLLTEQQAEVSTAVDAFTAIDLLAKQRFDVVLMDLQMPGMDGIEATRRIRLNAATQTLPVIAVTTLSSPEQRAQCLASGMNDFVPKPVDPEELLRAILRCLPSKESGVAAPQAIAPGGQVAPAAPVAVPPVHPLPGVDMASVMRRFNGRTAIIHSLFRQFSREFASSPQQLREALAAGDLVVARRLVHTSKGVAGNLGALRVATSSLALEQAILRGEASPAPELLEEYEQALAEVIDGVASLPS